jgi:hypothetical protein
MKGSNVVSNDHFRAFWNNWSSWLEGGPTPSGWTRTGERIPCDLLFKLQDPNLVKLSIDDVLSKNRNEVERWHLDLLRRHIRGETFDQLKDSAYWLEYLMPRLQVESLAEERVRQFIKLYEEFDSPEPIWVADVSRANVGLEYLRFDGCHRTCCAFLKDRTEIDALVFEAHPCSTFTVMMI